MNFPDLPQPPSPFNSKRDEFTSKCCWLKVFNFQPEIYKASLINKRIEFDCGFHGTSASKRESLFYTCHNYDSFQV